MKKFKFSIDGNPFEATVNELENHLLEVEVNGTRYSVEVDRIATRTVNQPAQAAPKSPGKVAPITAQPAQVSACAMKTIKSQLPGSIIKVLVEVGQTVAKGDVIMTIESMKMENNIMAEAPGKISKIYVEPGKSVMQDDKLVDIEVSSSSAAPAPVATPKPTPAPKPAVKETPKAEAPKAAGGNNGKPLKSPLPGSIIKILVTEGQAVKRGDVLLTMESMKMENEIKAEKDGVVTAIKVTTGQNVMQDEDLLILA